MKLPLRTILRGLAIALLALAYIDPPLSLFPQKETIPVLLDVSDSMAPDAVDQLIQKIKNSPIGPQAHIIPFAGKEASFSTPIDSFSDFKSFQSSWTKLDIGSSNIEGGLTRLLEGGNAILISDGYEHGGDLAQALPALRAASAKIFPLIPEQSFGEQAAFKIAQLDAPLTAPLNTSVPIRVNLQNTTGAAQSGILRVTEGGKELFKQKITVEGGNEQVVSVPSDGTLTGVQEITAVLTPDTQSFVPSQETTFLSGAKRDAVLLLSGSDEDSKFLRQALTEQSYEVEEKIISNTQEALPDLNNYSAVIFNNVGIKQLTSGAPQTIKTFVENGGGFCMIGGAKSFGLGGYRDTPIEQVLPVYLVPPETEQKRLNVGVELILDKSQSMDANNKIEFVKEAARQVVRNLKPDDYLGLIGFDEQPYVALPIGRIAEVRDTAMSQIGTFFPTGTTRLMPALQMGSRQIAKAPAGRKHMIVLTDGKLPDAGPMYIEATKQLRLQGVTLSTILLGGDSSTYPLREMADEGGGTFYQTNDPNMLPKVFLNDIKVSTGEKTLKEETQYDVRKGPAGIVSTSLQSFPTVKGYVQTKPKESSKLELIAYAGQSAEPLLASGNFGKGKSIAFTSDASGRWSAEWIAWPRFRQFWSEVVQSMTENANGNTQIKFELRPFVERGSVKLDLSIFSSGVGGQISAQTIYPDGKPHSGTFTGVSEGHYELSLDKPLPGRYQTEISVGGKKLTPITFNISGESFGEQKGRGFFVPTLEKIAGETGGVVNPDLSTLSGQSSRHEMHLQWLFILLALGCLGGEIYLREVKRG